MFTTICCPPRGGGKNESGESRHQADTAAEQWPLKKRAVPHSLCRPICWASRLPRRLPLMEVWRKAAYRGVGTGHRPGPVPFFT